MEIIGALFIGLIAGFLARFLVPGKDPMGIFGTLALGIGGSLLGNIVTGAFTDNDGVGIVGSTFGAIVLLLGWRAIKGRSERRPAN